MGKPQKVKVFANSNVVGLEKDMNAWLRSLTPPPVITMIQTNGWGTGGGAGEYTVICIVVYE
jgi:hypothetical protein